MVSKEIAQLERSTIAHMLLLLDKSFQQLYKYVYQQPLETLWHTRAKEKAS